jgi:hypothetical protein
MNDTIAALLFSLGVSLSAAIGFGVAWYRGSQRERRLEEQLFEGRPADGKLEDLEATIDAMARQMEQLTSGQEFLNRVVAERVERLPAPSSKPERDVTPH